MEIYGNNTTGEGKGTNALSLRRLPLLAPSAQHGLGETGGMGHGGGERGMQGPGMEGLVPLREL